MTEIFLTLKVKKFSKVEGDKVPDNVKILKLELSYPTDVGFMNRFYEKLPPDQVLKQITIGFFDGAEDKIYNKLLNKSEEDFFRLSWEKEKVNLLMPGKEDVKKDS